MSLSTVEAMLSQNLRQNRNHQFLNYIIGIEAELNIISYDRFAQYPDCPMFVHHNTTIFY